MPDATFACPDLTSFTGVADLGLEVVGQRLEPDRAVLACRVTEPDDWCRRCGCRGRPRDTVVRRLAHEPFGSPCWRSGSAATRAPAAPRCGARTPAGPRSHAPGCRGGRCADANDALRRAGIAWAQIGRFTQPDPARQSPTYNYTLGDPINGADFSGADANDALRRAGIASVCGFYSGVVGAIAGGVSANPFVGIGVGALFGYGCSELLNATLPDV